MLDRKTAFTVLMVLLLLPSAAVTQSQSPTRSSTKHATEEADDFAAVMQKIRDNWVQEFNAGHADKVAALYAQEAVLMRRNGSVHNRDSILAELQRSITAEAHNYTVHSLHAERSGDLGYDTGAYNVTLRDRVVEGNLPARGKENQRTMENRGPRQRPQPAGKTVGHSLDPSS